MEKTQDEYVNMYIHRAAETFLPPVGDVAYHSLMKGALNDKVRQYLDETLKSLFQNISKLNIPAVHVTTSKDATQDNLLPNDVDLKVYDKMLEDFFKQTKVKSQ